jgi:hypothetical protein
MNTSGFEAKQISATATIKTGGGRLSGFFVSSHTSGTIKIYDGTSTSGRVMFETITFGSPGTHFYELGNVGFGTGLHVVVGGTAQITIVYI